MTSTRALAFALIFGLLTGCGSKSGPGNAGAAQTPVLDEVAGLLRAAGASGRAPARLADLTKFESGYPTGYQAVKSGEIVVVYGAKMAGEGDAESAAADVIAYEKKTPTDGGFVLLQNGKVKQMSAAEFNAAPKAK